MHGADLVSWTRLFLLVDRPRKKDLTRKPKRKEVLELP